MGDSSRLDTAREATSFTADGEKGEMTVRPPHLNAFEFAMISALRTRQLLAGCTPRLTGTYRPTTMAQMEVAHGHVARADGDATSGPRQCGWQR